MEIEETQKEFPVGMRVLAVDDDRTCLMVLEALLRRCRYNVTATNEGVEALKLLRENKDGFDLVITDVDRPDMDGFKLLELVGLEMDLPVIMLSANCDTQMVMKGIRHGACDFLLKPVRLEEVKNVWQHVIRRRKIELAGQHNSDHATQHNGNDETNGEADQIEKRNRKRKEHHHEDDKSNSRGSSNEEVEATTRKKPRVLWTPHLHHLFLDAVNQLEFNPGNVVPKRILDLMRMKASQIMSKNITNTNVIDEKVLESLIKVQNLTRENVASHLQKYRNVLRKNEAASRQVYSGLEGKPFQSLALSSLDGSRNSEAFLGPREPSVLQRLKETAARLGSSIPYGKNQLHNMQKNTGNSELQQYNVYGNPQTCLHQWSPTSFDLKQNKPVANLENVFGRFTSSNSISFSPDGENCCQMTHQQMKDPNIISSHAKSSSLSTGYYATDTDTGGSSGLLGFTFGKETNNLLHINDSLALGYMAENIVLKLPQAEGNICSDPSEPTALTSLPSARTGSGYPCIGSTISGQTATTRFVENQWCFDLEILDDLKNTLEDPRQDQSHKFSFDNFQHPMPLEHGSMGAITGSEGLGADIIMTNQLCDAQLSLPSHDSWKWIGDIPMNNNEGYSMETSNDTGFDTS